MLTDPHPDEPAIVAAFLQQILDDRDRGVERTLAEYQRQFAGHEAAIAAEYEHVLTDAPNASTGGSEPHGAGYESPFGFELIRGPIAERYRDAEEIAAGGMGTIYRVWDPMLKRTLAKKVLGTRKRASSTTTTVVDRFLDEAQVTAQLDHPGIVPVHELGLDDEGRVYFTMALVRGRDFKAVIDLVHAGEWTLPRALGVLQRVCEAVAFAHSKGVIHRDLKPANIMVGPFGQTYVLDWGLARVVDEDTARSAADDDSPTVRSGRHDPAGNDSSPFLTLEGDVIGTPAYMAPEQARGDLDHVGTRSDVYAIGAMLYHLLAGRMPYGDTDTTTWQDVLDATLTGPPTPLSELSRDVPDELVAIQTRAMARDPGNRYESAHDLGEDLRAFLEDRVVRAHRTGAVAELSKWVQRNRLAAAAAALAAFSLVAGLGTSVWLKGVADDNAERAVLQSETQQAVLDFLNKDLLAAVAPGAVGKDATMRAVLDRAAESIEGRFPDRPLVEAAVRRTLADTYRRLGVLDAAERHATRSVKLYLGNDGGAEETLDARRVLAVIYRRQTRLREAAEENREILLLSRVAFGPRHEDTLTAANNLGLVLTYLGEREEAEPLLREVYEQRRSRLGHDHDKTLVSMCNLGLLYYNWGRYREAEPLIKGELDLCTKKHGEANPGTLVSMNNWANLLHATGRTEDAIAMHERVFRVSQEVRGETHPETIQALTQRARMLTTIERFDEVEALLEVARERAMVHGPDHRNSLEIETVHIGLLLARKDVAGALVASETHLARSLRVRGERAERSLQARRLRARALADSDQATAALQQVDAAIAAIGGDVTIELMRQKILRGELLTTLERYSEAESEMLAAERYFAERLPQARDHGAVIEQLIALYEAWGQPDTADTWRARLQ